MLVVGLTGGIGSGKTAVSDRFARYGVPIIDTDLLARELVEPGQPALTEIATAFGLDCLDGTGRLDRARLRERVFADASGRRRLEAILHPQIRALSRQRLASLPSMCRTRRSWPPKKSCSRPKPCWTTDTPTPP